MTIYKQYTQAELNKQYNNRLQVPEFADYINGWELRSRQAVQQYPAVKNIAYDDLPREQLDIYQSQFKPRIQCPMLLAAGSTETEKFIDQSTKLYKCWRENISIEFSPKISNTKFFVNHSRNSKKFILDN